MTKTTKAATLTTEVVTPVVIEAPAPTPAAPEMTPASVTLMPPTLSLFGSVPNVLAQIVVHARLGYIVDPDAPINQFWEAGTIGIYMRLGTPTDSIVKVAAETIEAATTAQRTAYTKDVLVAARQIVEEDKRTAREAEVAKKLEETRAQIAALEASLQA